MANIIIQVVEQKRDVRQFWATIPVKEHKAMNFKDSPFSPFIELKAAGNYELIITALGKNLDHKKHAAPFDLLVGTENVPWASLFEGSGSTTSRGLRIARILHVGEPLRFFKIVPQIPCDEIISLQVILRYLDD